MVLSLFVAHSEVIDQFQYQSEHLFCLTSDLDDPTSVDEQDNDRLNEDDPLQDLPIAPQTNIVKSQWPLGNVNRNFSMTSDQVALFFD